MYDNAYGCCVIVTIRCTYYALLDLIRKTCGRRNPEIFNLVPFINF